MDDTTCGNPSLSSTEVDIGSSSLFKDHYARILCVSWKDRVLGGAYYDKDSCDFHLMPDCMDAGPGFEMLKTLLSEVEPQIVVISKNLGTVTSDVISDYLRSVVVLRDDGEHETGNLEVCSAKDFNYDSCSLDLLSLESAKTKGFSREEIVFFNSSLINIESVEMIKSAGALLKYLRRHLADVISERSR